MAKGVETRERIVEQALQVASIDGLEGISIGRLADEVGMSKSGLFAHFRSKEELQLAVLTAAVAKFTEIVVRPALAAPRGEPRLRALFDRWLVWEQHASVPGGCVFMHLSVELDDRPGAARDALATAQQRWLDTVARIVQLGVEIGHFRPEADPGLVAFQLHGLLSSYYHRKRLLRAPDAEALVRRAFDALVASIRAAS